MLAWRKKRWDMASWNKIGDRLFDMVTVVFSGLLLVGAASALWGIVTVLRMLNTWFNAYGLPLSGMLWGLGLLAVFLVLGSALCREAWEEQ
jgi:hypothetical protein